jgi:hypothetical protein
MVSVQLTLTSANTNYSLITLAQAVDANFPAKFTSLLIEADAANAAGSKVSFGDTNTSATRYGYQLGPGDSRSYSGSFPVGDLYARGSGAGLKVNLEAA